MLPDDYENLAEAVVASSLFSQNVLEAITTKNYWNIQNTYKPLMHLWYISVLFQIYIILSVLYATSIYFKEKLSFKFLLALVTFSSLILSLFPFSDSTKFYSPVFRFFEFGLGGILVYFPICIIRGKYVKYYFLITIFILVSLFTPFDYLPGNRIRLYIAVFCSCLFILCSKFKYYNALFEEHLLIKILGKVGVMSYSIYVFHQMIIAFMLYAIVPKMTSISIIFYVLLLIIICYASYIFFENKLVKIYYKHKYKGCCAMAICLVCNISIGFYYYNNAGYTRDVPELDVYSSNVHKGMHAEYVDKPNKWRNSFKNNNKTHLLVIGNSFGRDFANILNESVFSSDIDICYFSDTDIKISNKQNILELTNKADYVFCTLGPGTTDLNPLLFSIVPKEKLLVVGNKKFGYSNGIVYSKRLRSDYYLSSQEISLNLLEHNLLMKKKYGQNFIDMFQIVLNSDNRVRVFTDENKFISQDTTHLTKAGAIYYSKKLDIKQYIVNRK